MRGRIGKTLDLSEQIKVTENSRFVFISDCHRGLGDGADNLAKNHNAYITALRHYYDNGFTYFELGDGDELWENRDFNHIVASNAQIFKLMMRFHEKGRLFMLNGNHDAVKKNKKWVRDNLYSYFDSRKNSLVPLFPGITAYEGLRLKHTPTGGEVFILHGHQADFFNDRLGFFARFLVKNLWRPVEVLGLTDPTSASKNRAKKHAIESKLSGFANAEKIMIIAGHTHRTMFPKPGGGLYFNDGCCVHPRQITAIELESGLLTLVKWSVEAGGDGFLRVERNIIAGPHRLSDYFMKQA